MPAYRITGLDRETGQPQARDFAAPDEATALDQAAEAGIVVESCREVESPAAIPALRRWCMPRISSDGVPEYLFLRILGWIYLGVGGLTALIGLLSVIGSIGDVSRPARTDYRGEVTREAYLDFWRLAPGFTIVVFGLLILGVAQGVLAFRDIARNSWRSANAAEHT